MLAESVPAPPASGHKKAGPIPDVGIEILDPAGRRQVLPQWHPGLPHPGCYHGRVTVGARTGNQRNVQVFASEWVKVSAKRCEFTINRANRTHSVWLSSLQRRALSHPATE